MCADPRDPQCLIQNRISYPQYDALIAKLLNGESLPQDSTPWDV